jgi:microsomal dipeptidase-like Zn-dependent dipeptidase
VIADLHAHYPMHLVPAARGSLLDLIATRSGRRRLGDRIRALLVGVASRIANHQSFDSGPRVTVASLRAGGVGLALSVLYSFFDEVDMDVPYAGPPRPGYIEDLVRELDLVEAEIAANHGLEAALARNPAELDAVLESGRVALVHCVEGGFHLGATPEAVDQAVTRLAGRGVAYVILAHLFFRQIATNAPAIPFLPDGVYRFLFHQPDEGLTELGRAAVAAMVRERMLIDASHMTEHSIRDTLAQLDQLDPERKVPLLASHTAFRFGKQGYTMPPEIVSAIAARDGVIGLIFAQHQLLDGLPRHSAKTFAESFETLCVHIDKLAEVTGSHRHIGLGSDFDGFIKPTLGGLETEADMAKLELALRERYGDETAGAICSGNALRLLRTSWGGARTPMP